MAVEPKRRPLEVDIQCPIDVASAEFDQASPKMAEAECEKVMAKRADGLSSNNPSPIFSGGFLGGRRRVSALPIVDRSKGNIVSIGLEAPSETWVLISKCKFPTEFLPSLVNDCTRKIVANDTTTNQMQ